MQPSEKIYQLALHLINGIGPHSWMRLIQQVGSAQALFEMPLSTLQMTIKRLPPAILKAIVEKSTLSTAEQLLHTHQQQNIQSHSFFEASYPERLKHIAQPPSFLYSKGPVNFGVPRVVSIVGTRNASSYGKRVVADLLAGLVGYDVLVVSGLAYGIDIHAHIMALQHGLPTVAVLASGLDVIYPAAHKKTAEAMLAQGGLVTEIPIGHTLERFRFPYRNRIIAGLADATLVVEAPVKSGAMITAHFANSYDREVFAVPGSIDANCSAGCNQLIKTQQAHLITAADDLAYIMNWTQDSRTMPCHQRCAKQYANLSQEELRPVEILQRFKKEMHIDALSEHTQLSPSSLAPLLLQLELKNVLQLLPGSKWKLVDA